MLKKDLIFECTFYGRRPDSLGCMYYRPNDLPIKNPEILFFCFYALRVLVEKKVAILSAEGIKKRLSQGKELKEILEGCEKGESPFEVKLTEYRGFSNIAFSSSILFHKQMVFRFGYIGFGFFMNKKKFNVCAEHSVYGLLYTIYRLNKNNAASLAMLWEAAELIGALNFGKELNKGNYQDVAKKIYRAVTKDITDYLDTDKTGD